MLCSDCSALHGVSTSKKKKQKKKKNRNDSLPQVLHIQTAGGGGQNLHDFVTELKK